MRIGLLLALGLLAALGVAWFAARPGAGSEVVVGPGQEREDALVTTVLSERQLVETPPEATRRVFEPPLESLALAPAVDLAAAREDLGQGELLVWGWGDNLSHQVDESGALLFRILSREHELRPDQARPWSGHLYGARAGERPVWLCDYEDEGEPPGFLRVAASWLEEYEQLVCTRAAWQGDDPRFVFVCAAPGYEDGPWSFTCPPDAPAGCVLTSWWGMHEDGRLVKGTIELEAGRTLEVDARYRALVGPLP